MKLKYIMASAAFAFMMCFTSCLDIVPDEIATEEDAFKDRTAARNYVYSCYSYLPQSNIAQSALDLLTGDEVITAFEHETFASFPKGNYSASNTVISYWNTFFQGLRQCYLFLENVDRVPDLDNATKQDYISQVKFLIAYYHYMLIRCYGPTIVIRNVVPISTPADNYQKREPLDACVEFVCGMFDEAAAGLPPKRPSVTEYGLATSVACKALKAKMRLYAASPLFNAGGGDPDATPLYTDFKDKDGQQLMPVSYDPNKWVLARDAMKEAIDFAKQNGYDLYKKTDFTTQDSQKYPSDPTVHCLRMNIIERGNAEILYAETRDEGQYGIQNKSMPYVDKCAWNGIAPTWAMLNRFYTKNGLPWDEDPEYKDKDKMTVVTVTDANANEACVGKQTIAFNLNREPRFYAWIAFQGGYYEVLNATTNGGYDKWATSGDYNDGRVTCNFLLGGICGRGTVEVPRAGNYSPTGYLNKKGVNPGNQLSTTLGNPYFYPWPVVRLADLYLGYAEACVETGDYDTAIEYMDYIRERAGVPKVEEAWSKAGVSVSSDKDRLRKIVRQERMIELYLENQNFWDMRRWLIAEDYFGNKAQGMNIDTADMNEFATLTEVDFERKFDAQKNYLLPIPSTDINRNLNLVQNPGY